MSMNLDISFEMDKLILTLGKEDPDTDQKLTEFGRLSFGTTRYKKLVKNGKGAPVELEKYMEQRAAELSSPDMRRMLAQLERVRADHVALEQRVTALEQRPVAEPEDEERTKARRLSNQRAVEFHGKLKARQPKALRIEAAIKFAGYDIVGVTPAGNSTRIPGQEDKTFYAVALAEEFYERYGEVSFQRILNTMASFENVPPRTLYLQAIAYCLCESPTSMAPEAFYVEADKYFRRPYKELKAQLLKARDPAESKVSLGAHLGRIIQSGKAL